MSQGTNPGGRKRWFSVPGVAIPVPPFGTQPGTVVTDELKLGSPANENQQILGADGQMFVHHPGDVFLPGAGNWVYEPTTERVPLQTIWGNGFLVHWACYFKPLQPPQVYASQTVVQNGLGGLMAGQYVGQPLLYDSGVNALEQGANPNVDVTESGI